MATAAIVGGGLAIGGAFTLWNWNIEFQEGGANVMNNRSIYYLTAETITYSTFGTGWLASVTSSGLAILGSFIFLLVRPKK